MTIEELRKLRNEYYNKGHEYQKQIDEYYFKECNVDQFQDQYIHIVKSDSDFYLHVSNMVRLTAGVRFEGFGFEVPNDSSTIDYLSMFKDSSVSVRLLNIRNVITLTKEEFYNKLNESFVNFQKSLEDSK